MVPGGPRRVSFAPFFSYRHRLSDGDPGLFWHERRHPSSWQSGSATDVSLSFVDQQGETLYPEFQSVAAELTCFNGSLPSQLSIGSEQGDLDLVLLNWGNETPPYPEDWVNQLPGTGDFDTTLVDQEELDGVLLNWGSGIPGEGAVAVPEPATWLLLLAMGSLCLRRSRPIVP